MNSDKSSNIYVYDDEEQQIIIIDSETGERVEQQENHVLSLLHYLKKEIRYDDLRRFTLWCTRRSNPYIKPLQKKFIELGERAVQGNASTRELRQLYKQSEGQAVATDTVGLARGASGAAGFLASRECVNPDAFEGAGKAARFHCLWAEMNQANNDSPDFMEEIDIEVSEGAVQQIEQKQVDCLLDLIGK